MKKFALTLVAASALALCGMAQASNDHSQGHNNGNGHSSEHGKPGLRSGLISLDKHVYYPGDTVHVRVTIPSSLTGYWSGKADAYILVSEPNGDLLSVQLSAPAPDTQRALADVPTDQLPAGSYQLAFILVKTGGDPTVISDWYQGFSGLVSTQRLVISASNTSGEDSDGSGEVDGDQDGDGYPDN